VQIHIDQHTWEGGKDMTVCKIEQDKAYAEYSIAYSRWQVAYINNQRLRSAYSQMELNKAVHGVEIANQKIKSLQ
jgi:O-phosphoseryl-tRNA(Cys) synthetase